MKTKRCIAFALLVLVLTSCSSNSGDKDIVVMDFSKNILEEVNPDFRINDIVEDVEFVPLETVDGAILSYPSILSINSNGKMCCMDYQDYSINVYDINGKFDFRVNKRGKGSGEYLQPVYAQINESNNIDVFGLYENKMFEYDKAGILLSETPFKDGVLIANFDKDRYAVKYNTRVNSTTHYMNISDRKGNIVENLIEIDTLRRFNDYYSGGFVKAKNSVFFIRQTTSSDILYEYKEGKLNERANIELGQYRPDSTSKNAMNPKWIQYLNINVASNYLMCNFFHNNNQYFDIWNIKNGEHILRKIINLSDKNSVRNPYYEMEDGTKISVPLFDGSYHDGKIVVCVPAYLVSPYLKNVKEDDNYVLFVAKIK